MAGRRKSPHSLGPRPGETIGSGIIVVGRVSSGRLDPVRVPYEHPDVASAVKEAMRLGRAEPDKQFGIFMDVGKHGRRTPK